MIWKPLKIGEAYEGETIQSERQIKYVMQSDKSGTAINTYYLKHMYERLTNLNVLYDAFMKSKAAVDWKCSVQRYEATVFPRLLKLQKELANGTYKQKPFVEFNINERGKRRHIKSLDISDRVMQRALCDYILIPSLYPYIIYDNGASVKGKGIEFSRKRLVAHLQKYYRKYGCEGYILIVDFRKFFDSIPHKKVMDEIEKRIKDDRVINLLKKLLKEFDDSPYEFAKSVGIGSQISQVIGVYYPTRIDNYVKIVKQCKYYGRYMDDLYVIHKDKDFLKKLLLEICAIADEMGLEVHPTKTQISKINKGFTYLKIRYILTDTGRIVRKSCKANMLRERRKLKKLKPKVDEGIIPIDDIRVSYNSWRGEMKRFDNYRSLLTTDKLFISLYGGDTHG